MVTLVLRRRIRVEAHLRCRRPLKVDGEGVGMGVVAQRVMRNGVWSLSEAPKLRMIRALCQRAVEHTIAG
jgi:hypothetical protein